MLQYWNAMIPPTHKPWTWLLARTRHVVPQANHMSFNMPEWLTHCKDIRLRSSQKPMGWNTVPPRIKFSCLFVQKNTIFMLIKCNLRRFETMFQELETETGCRIIWIDSSCQTEYTDQYSFCLKEIGHTVFKICLYLVSLFYIVFANILMKLMRKIRKICSLILIFANILPISYE